MPKSKTLGPKWPRKLKREAFERSLFVQAVQAEFNTMCDGWLADLRLHMYDGTPGMPVLDGVSVL